MSMSPQTAAPANKRRRLYEILTGDERAQVCRDVPEAACRHQSANFTRHLFSLSLTKAGDALADPKLVLAWLLHAVGAPSWQIGLLVPLRESLAMLPQLVISAHIRRRPIRKTVFALGCILQGLAMLAIGLSTLTLSGLAAGWIAIGAIAVFGLARSLCSISHKDVLGKTVSKGKRGTLNGSAGTFAAACTLILALSFASGAIPISTTAISITVMLAGGLWLAAAFSYQGLNEEPGATDGAINGLKAVSAQLKLFRSDPQLSWFVTTRGLLLSSALAPPFLIALSGSANSRQLGALGAFMIASAMAGLLSTYIWGRLSDKSSRQVLLVSAAIAAAANLAAALVAIYTPGLLSSAWLLPALLFVLTVAHQGVRLGRSTHVVDMADRDSRATYTALSNSAVGVLLLAGGAFGTIAFHFGTHVVLLIFGVMACCAIVAASQLQEVQQNKDELKQQNTTS